MKNFNYVVNDLNSLETFLGSSEMLTYAQNSKGILIQVFSSQTDKIVLENINEAILSKYPTAIIVGSTSVGEIVEGLLNIGAIVLSISFFDATIVKPIVVPNTPNEEFQTGLNLIHTINAMGTDVAGVLLLATPQSIDVAKVFKGMEEAGFSYSLFGGGAGEYDSTEDSMIFCGNEFYNQGMIAVVFLSQELHIYTSAFLGWKSLSKEMIITECKGKLLKKVDDINAIDIYHRYLGIQNDMTFFDSVLEFPLLLERDGDTIARVPFFATKKGYIGFNADLEVGEKVHIGYGDPDTIIKNSTAIQKDMYDFQPDVIFLFACICRRFLMQNDVNLETQPYNAIAPTVGFYTHGEFYGRNSKIQLLNSTIVVVGMREGDEGQVLRQTNDIVPGKALYTTDDDPFSNKHNRIVSKLLYFINAVSSELEQANKELTKISGVDKLTQIYNRFKLDDIFQSEICRCERYNSELSIIILDLDYFKLVNDNYGHIAGDEVLVHVARILRNNIRETDAVGRWGGEEFLVILPETDIKQACLVAEKISVAISTEQFPVVKHITCSFGVATYSEKDDQDKMMLRADKALYQAKNDGRNKVIASEETN